MSKRTYEYVAQRTGRIEVWGEPFSDDFSALKASERQPSDRDFRHVEAALFINQTRV